METKFPNLSSRARSLFVVPIAAAPMEKIGLKYKLRDVIKLAVQYNTKIAGRPIPFRLSIEQNIHSLLIDGCGLQRHTRVSVLYVVAMCIRNHVSLHKPLFQTNVTRFHANIVDTLSDFGHQIHLVNSYLKMNRFSNEHYPYRVV